MTAGGVAAVRRPPARFAAPADSGPALRRWLSGAALAVGTAGALHLAAAVEHVAAGELAVGFFLLTAAAQLGLAGRLAVAGHLGRPPGPALVAVAIAGTVALLGLYLVAETTPLLDAFTVTVPGSAGHAHGGAEGIARVDPVTGVDFSAGMATRADGPVAMAGAVPTAAHAHGGLGTVTVAAEVLGLAVLTGLLPVRWRRRAVDAMLAAGALGWLLWFTGALG